MINRKYYQDDIFIEKHIVMATLLFISSSTSYLFNKLVRKNERSPKIACNGKYHGTSLNDQIKLTLRAIPFLIEKRILPKLRFFMFAHLNWYSQGKMKKKCI